MDTVLAVKHRLRVPRDVMRTFTRAAAVRGTDVDTLAMKVLARVSRDDLVDAVIDDGAQTPSSGDRYARMQCALDNAVTRVAELEAILFCKEVDVPRAWKLPRREAQIFRLLLMKDRLTKDQIGTAIYDVTDEIDLKTIESHVSKLKRKVAAYGAQIEGKRFLGYSLRDRHDWRRRLGAAS